MPRRSFTNQWTWKSESIALSQIDRRVKRARDKKTRRAKTIKQLTSMGRRHLLGVRVVMKNMVYVTGMKIPGSGDEVGASFEQY